MPTPTYTLIQEYSLGSASTISFTNIPQNYKHLILEGVVRAVGNATSNGVVFRINNDSGSNYSNSRLYGNGSSAATQRESNTTFARVGEMISTNGTANNFGSTQITFFDYSNTSTNKIIISNSRNGSDGLAIDVICNLWRSTSAITSINTISTDITNNLAAGSTLRLWGVVG